VSSSAPALADTRRGRGDREAAARRALERAIVQTVAYADVFDYPLTADEVHRYLIGLPANRATVRGALSSSKLLSDLLSRSGRYITLAGRESIIETRRRRAAISSEYWVGAVGYGRQIGGLPFVRMVAVTGALAMDNVGDADIDYLIVTEPGRLWLCRGLVVGIVRLAALRGVTLCPNYFLTENTLVLEERNLFTAHEVTQMVPVAGMATYEVLRTLNDWTASHLPNAGGPPRRMHVAEGRERAWYRLAETALRSRLGGRIERWEMERKLSKLRKRGDGHAEAAFGPDWCKGHFGDHGGLTLARFDERWRRLEPRLV
jgi:hypothetical protein